MKCAVLTFRILTVVQLSKLHHCLASLHPLHRDPEAPFPSTHRMILSNFANQVTDSGNLSWVVLMSSLDLQIPDSWVVICFQLYQNVFSFDLYSFWVFNSLRFLVFFSVLPCVIHLQLHSLCPGKRPRIHEDVFHPAKAGSVLFLCSPAYLPHKLLKSPDYFELFLPLIMSFLIVHIREYLVWSICNYLFYVLLLI